jgi:hypothetical protein
MPAMTPAGTPASQDDRPVEVDWPRSREMMADWLDLGQRRHTMSALLEVEVTGARAAIRARRARTGRPLSLTAYLVACLARAIALEPAVASMRHGRRRMVVFPRVDVAVPMQHEVEMRRQPLPHIVRAADRASLEDIDRAIAKDAHGDAPYERARRMLPLWLLLPAWLRRQVMGHLLANAYRRRRMTGTALVTVVSLPSRGRAWGLPEGTSHPVSLVVGGLRCAQDGRQWIGLTLVFDHDTVDGAPAARFVRRFGDLVERGGLLLDDERAAGDPTSNPVHLT